MSRLKNIFGAEAFGWTRRWPGFLTALLACAVSLVAVSDKSQPTAKRNTVRLQAGADGTLSASVDDLRPVSTDEVWRNKGVMTLNELSLAGDAEHDGFMIQAGEHEVLVLAGGFDGWSATVGKRCRATFSWSAKTSCIDVFTSTNNPAPVTLLFGDGGTAEIGDESSVRFDLFRDKSYTLSGHGKVTAVSSDGRKAMLSSVAPPMSGGPLVVTAAPAGESVHQRLSPTILVRIEGEPASNLVLRAGAQIIRLSGTNQQEVTFQNGSVLVLEQNSRVGFLKWHVEKGDFRFSIDGVAGWRACALTGQSAAMTWNKENRAVDLSNTSPDTPILAALPNQTFARLAPGATFQFAEIDRLTFATSASGAGVVLFNASTGRETDLGQGNLLFKSGLAFSPGKTPTPRNAIKLAWRNDSALDVSSSAGNVRVRVHEEKTVRGVGQSQLQVQFRQPGQILIKSLLGDYRIYPNALGNLSIALSEGDGFMLGIDPQHGLVTSHALAQNVSPISLTVADRMHLQLPPDEGVTLFSPALGWSGLLSTAAIFSESLEAAGSRPAGDDVFGYQPAAPSGSWPFGRYRHGLYDNRIPQPPVSVVR